MPILYMLGKGGISVLQTSIFKKKKKTLDLIKGLDYLNIKRNSFEGSWCIQIREKKKRSDSSKKVKKQIDNINTPPKT